MWPLTMTSKASPSISEKDSSKSKECEINKLLLRPLNNKHMYVVEKSPQISRI